jgi:large repetitive protein
MNRFRSERVLSVPRCRNAVRALAGVAMALFTLAHSATAIAVTISPAAVPSGTAGTPYSQTFTASGGQPPYRFSNEVGRLPNGLTLSSGGTLSGTPSAATVPFEIWVTDADGREAKVLASTTTIAYALTISPTLTPAVINVGYMSAIAVSGGVTPYSCALTTGALPPGVALASDCSFSGIPTSAGSFSFTVTVSDAGGGSGTQVFTLLVAAAPVAVVPAIIPTLSSSMIAVLLLAMLMLSAAGIQRKNKLSA